MSINTRLPGLKTVLFCGAFIKKSWEEKHQLLTFGILGVGSKDEMGEGN